ncbi:MULTISPECIES: glycoside hydrolase family 16 protein [Pseudonocardia]|uniref:Glycosyl hydrolases family 16 n=2 Tax=Pseudonocardia TaxID=1847 RepID=A0A1Y2N4P8_PSEAH|nr:MULTISPECIES: glycoside hydrolase family 16 protein [Pseudonocardia]OSY42141.1 Glycosyl hydrolases family 16 [Pseudonocardia autotrophica]TDN75091.1 glycosyl hydrolase family 16 [Pseudonocardia autotrophica]BBF99035.1 hypothetical protein Pdca_02450 [Pseudonocardia autotrophica]GEC23955.1 hypothetical protein PSA01_09840 [Pseudonocardia saturnea]
MRRKSSAAADQVDPRDLIERVAAEHSSPSVHFDRGRHADPAAASAVSVATLLEDAPVTASGRHRRAAGGTATALAIAELHEPDDRPAGDGGSGSGSGGRSSGDSTVIEIDRAASARRSRFRRLAPLGVGAAAILAATMVLTLLQPGTEDPSLSTALIDDSSRRSVSGSTLATNPAVGSGGGTALGDAALGATDRIGEAIAAREAAEQRARERARAGTDRQQAPAGGGGGGDAAADGSGNRAAPGAASAPQVAGDGVQAALARGWQAAGGDEFTGSSLGNGWSAYDSAGHDGQGRRTPDAVSVEDGNLVIRGDSQGNTGGIAWGTPRQYGKWEVRAQFPAGDRQYHPVILLWPSEIEWPRGGEIDFAETTSASDDVSFFLHYGSDNSQVDATRTLDITQWNNYAVEWTPNAVIGYVNGEEWFRSEDPQTLPPGPMHAAIQLDYFPGGGAPAPSEMRVAWMRMYS